MKNTKIDRRILQSLPVLSVGFLAAMSFYGWFVGLFGITPAWFLRGMDWLSTFATVFLGIFIEAAPFLLLGTLASGLVEVFFDPHSLAQMIPRQRFAAAVVGSLLGLFFPVSECGVVPLTRRLAQKGLPMPSVIAFLLAAPVLNPIVIVSTYSAFGMSEIFWGRIGLTLLISISVGLIFSFQSDNLAVLQPIKFEHPHLLIETDAADASLTAKLQKMIVIAADEFFEMGRYLVIGGLLAAVMQTLIPQPSLQAVGNGPLMSAVLMILLGVLLSVGSAADSFIALSFSSALSSGSMLAFLVYGSMVDIKSVFLYSRVFKPRTVVYLVVLPLLLTLLAALSWNILAG